MKKIFEKHKENKLSEMIKPTYKKKDLYKNDLNKIQKKTEVLLKQHSDLHFEENKHKAQVGCGVTAGGFDEGHAVVLRHDGRGSIGWTYRVP